jgi:hypothetical protein
MTGRSKNHNLPVGQPLLIQPRDPRKSGAYCKNPSKQTKLPKLSRWAAIFNIESIHAEGISEILTGSEFQRNPRENSTTVSTTPFATKLAGGLMHRL